MAKTLCLISLKEEGEINQILYEVEADSSFEPDITIKDFICPKEIIKVIIPEIPRFALPKL